MPTPSGFSASHPDGLRCELPPHRPIYETKGQKKPAKLRVRVRHTGLFHGENPGHELLAFGFVDLRIGGHGNRTPDTSTTLDHFG